MNHSRWSLFASQIIFTFRFKAPDQAPAPIVHHAGSRCPPCRMHPLRHTASSKVPIHDGGFPAPYVQALPLPSVTPILRIGSPASPPSFQGGTTMPSAELPFRFAPLPSVPASLPSGLPHHRPCCQWRRSPLPERMCDRSPRIRTPEAKRR